MNTVRTTVRWIITASLLLSLSLASVYPRLTASDDVAVVVAANQDQLVCCCGTEDGRCCGMACCQMPNPKEGKAPASPNQSEVRGQPLGFVLAAEPTLHDLGAARFRHVAFRGSAITSSPSLMALGIRLNT
jgi:hypothetical protein